MLLVEISGWKLEDDSRIDLSIILTMNNKKTLSLVKPCIYHPSLQNSNSCWLQIYYPKHAISRNELGSNERPLIEYIKTQDFDHNIICAEPYFMPVPWDSGIPIFVLLGDFHHQEASVSELVAYVANLRKANRYVFIASSCQPWLGRVLEEVTSCIAFDYIETPLNSNNIFEFNNIPLEESDKDSNPYEICSSISDWQPKRTIYLWNLLRHGFPEGRMHMRQSKECWLRQLYMSRAPYRVPLISGQLSPQITYPALFGRSVITDANSAVKNFFKDKNLADMLNMYELNADWKNADYKSLDIRVSSHERFLSNLNKIKSSDYTWTPGLKLYSWEDPMQHKKKDSLSEWQIWTLDMITSLKAKHYIKSIVIENSDTKESMIHKSLLSLGSSISQSIRGVPELNIRLLGDGSAMEIRDSCKRECLLIKRTEVSYYLKIVNNDYSSWRQRISARTMKA